MSESGLGVCDGVVLGWLGLQPPNWGPHHRHGHSTCLRDGTCEARRDSVLSSRSHGEGKGRNQRQKSGSPLVLAGAGWGQGQSPLSTLLFFSASVSQGTAQEAKGFLETLFPFISQWETEAQGGALAHTGPHTVSRLGPQPRAISVWTRGGFVSPKWSLPAPAPPPQSLAGW